MKSGFYAILLLLGCSCSHPAALKARTEYLNSTYLASTQVRTPEPCHACFVGEQIVISWRLLDQCPVHECELVLALRYGDQECAELTRPLKQRFGTKIYRLLNAEYRKRKGITAYSVKIVCNGKELHRWDSHLWQEIIHIDDA